MERQHTDLHAVAFGLALGLLWGVGVALLALTTWLFGYGHGFVEGLGQLYLGYDHDPLGALIGFVWGFFDFFVFGWLIAFLYNKFKSLSIFGGP